MIIKEITESQKIKTSAKCKTIETVSLDDFFVEKEINIKEIAFIWCDAQGHEGFILEGAKSLLEQKKTPWLVEFQMSDEMKKSESYHLFIKNLGKYFTFTI